MRTVGVAGFGVGCEVRPPLLLPPVFTVLPELLLPPLFTEGFGFQPVLPVLLLPPVLLPPPLRVVEVALPVDLPPPVRTVLLRFETRVMSSSESCGVRGTYSKALRCRQ